MTFGAEGHEGASTLACSPSTRAHNCFNPRVLIRPSGARVHDIKTIEDILDIFQSHGHVEVRPCSCRSSASLSQLTLHPPARYLSDLRIRHVRGAPRRGWLA